MLLECLSTVADARRAQGQRYPLCYVLLFSILVILGGATSYRQVQRFMHAHRERLLEAAPETEGPVAIALDGKVLRGSFDRFEDQKAVQVLSALCQAERLIVGHLPVSHQTNEIPVAQQLIEELGLTGCLYTLDALHCQKKLSRSSNAKAMP
jgi:hypothetical protein